VSPDVSATAAWYARAAIELAQTSERQVEWALGVADDPELLALIQRLPREHRQPSLIFAVARWCGAPVGGYAEWRAWVVRNWAAIGGEATRRRTQTNEVGRCIPLLLGLDRFDGPIALLELGAAAGLCLAVDRYAYRFDDQAVLAPVLAPAGGPAVPTLAASTSGLGPAAPTHLPEIVWRAGIDLAPLDVRDADDVRWLEALLPPDRPARRDRLHAAVATVAADPPRLVAGDALTTLPALAAEARAQAPGATLVVASLGTLVYLPPADRAAMPDAVAGLGAHLLAFESSAALPHVAARLSHLTAPEPTPFVLSLDGEPLAGASAHGERVSWLSPRPAGRGPRN
jgi:hypothetical protein